jgi:hypothetical protein
MAAQLVIGAPPLPLEARDSAEPASAPPPEELGVVESVPLPVTAPYTGPATRRREAIAKGPFFVSTLDWTAQSYALARYEQGRPQPYGAIARVSIDASRRCPGLSTPSVTRDAAGTYFLYASQRTCDKPVTRELTLWTSTDGVNFTRRGPVRGDREMGGTHVVYDRGLFRAWYSRVDGQLLYGESRDGRQFTRVGGGRAPAGDPEQVVKHNGEWYLVYSRLHGAHQRPVLLKFADPRQPRYEEVAFDVPRRSTGARLAAPSATGQRAIDLTDAHAVKPGDLVVVATRGEEADASQVERVDGSTVRLRSGLGVAHTPGDRVELAGAGSIVPSYVCRERDGTWAGIFSVFQALPSTLYEVTLVYRAESINGPWRVDRHAQAPILALENEQRRRSVVAPAAPTRGVGVPRCGA